MGGRNFEEAVAFARAVERAVAAWLRSRGHLTLPVYDYSGLADGKAPKLEAEDPTESLVTPDLLAVKDGHCMWVEVKWKARADYTRKTERLETGISLRLWRHYRAVRATSGLPVWILFVHRDENEVRGAELQDLAEMARIYDGGKMGHSGMVFFPWERLRFVLRTSALGIDEPTTDTRMG